METKFNSQICTTIEQSERLLALGLRKETADMYYTRLSRGDSWTLFIGKPLGYEDIPTEYLLPAWSLSRLIEMMPDLIKHDEMLYHQTIDVHGVEYDNRYYEACQFLDGTLFDNIISCIEWLIEWGHFNEKYLV